LRLEARILNHSPRAETYRLGWNAPPGWKLVRADRSLKIPPRAEARGAAEFEAAAAGLHLVTLDVSFAGRELKQWTEALVEVKAANR
jgi:hypothetical protein